MSKRLNGRLVHWVVNDGPEEYHGQCRPAVVVQDWRHTAADPGWVNLVVFRDGGNESAAGALVQWKTSVDFSLPHKFDTWYFAEDCEA